MTRSPFDDQMTIRWPINDQMTNGRTGDHYMTRWLLYNKMTTACPDIGYRKIYTMHVSLLIGLNNYRKEASLKIWDKIPSHDIQYSSPLLTIRARKIGSSDVLASSKFWRTHKTETPMSARTTASYSVPISCFQSMWSPASFSETRKQKLSHTELINGRMTWIILNKQGVAWLYLLCGRKFEDWYQFYIKRV